MGEIGFYSDVRIFCTRHLYEKELAQLQHRLAYPGGKKARSAARRMRALTWLMPQ